MQWTCTEREIVIAVKDLATLCRIVEDGEKYDWETEVECDFGDDMAGIP